MGKALVVMVWVSSLTLVMGQYPNTEYGNLESDVGFFGGADFFRRSSSNGFESSRSSSRGGYSADNDNSDHFSEQNYFSFGDQSPKNQDSEEEPEKNGESSSQSPKTYKFVSVHIAPPEEPAPKRPSRPQAPQKPEKHYQIVFIKAPSAHPQEAQEIQLPPQPQTKTLVYVLLKKPGLNELVRIKTPPTPKPTAPEVFFIRYKGQGDPKQKVNAQGQGGQGAQGGSGLEERGYSNPPNDYELSNVEDINSLSQQYGNSFRK